VEHLSWPGGWEPVFAKDFQDWLMWVDPKQIHPYPPHDVREPTTVLSLQNFVAAMGLIRESGMEPPHYVYPNWDGSLSADWHYANDSRAIVNIRNNFIFARSISAAGIGPFPVEL
jgi:hypothetical protein